MTTVGPGAATGVDGAARPDVTATPADAETEFVLYDDAVPALRPDAPGPTPPGPTTLDRRLTQLGRDSLYVLTAFPLLLIAFVLAVVLTSVGVGLAVLWVGFPILVAGLGIARGCARLERLRIDKLEAKPAPVHAYASAREGAGPFRRLIGVIADPQSWLDVLWTLVGLITGTIAWGIGLVWWSSALSGLSYPFWQAFVPYSPGNMNSLAELIGFRGRVSAILLNTLLGALFAISLPPVLRWTARLNASVSDLLLNSRARLRDQVEAERATRQRHQEAEAVALRRLERDIHDGPQQRLVRLGMDLGRARKQLATDPEKATRTIDEALKQARETVDELRSLTRGIAPPLLVDRGLAVALDEVVNRATLPVDLAVDLPPAVPAQVETACYFVVSEALTNIAKHSGATQAGVTVRPERAALAVTVVDDGVGGAHESKGTGLAGLRSRIEGVGGDLTITSPDGGPTVLRATLPLLGVDR